MGLTVYVANVKTNMILSLFLDNKDDSWWWARSVTMNSYIHFYVFCRDPCNEMMSMHESVEMIHLL